MRLELWYLKQWHFSVLQPLNLPYLGAILNKRRSLEFAARHTKNAEISLWSPQTAAHCRHKVGLFLDVQSLFRSVAFFCSSVSHAVAVFFLSPPLSLSRVYLVAQERQDGVSNWLCVQVMLPQLRALQHHLGRVEKKPKVATTKKKGRKERERERE